MPAVHNSKAGKIVVHRGGQETQTQKWTGLRGLAIPTCARARVGEASVSIMTTTKTELYDVVAVNIDTNKVRLMAEKKTLPIRGSSAILNPRQPAYG